MLAQAVDILLVEDNPGDVYLTTEALLSGKLPKRIHVVTDGAEALAFLAKKDSYRDAPRPDLILLDLNLPKVSGARVLENVKSKPDLRQIPIIVFSTSDAERDVQHAYEQRANCYLRKPVDLDEFMNVVGEIEEYWLNCVLLPQ